MDANRQVQDGRQSDAELRQMLQRAEGNVTELTARCDDLEQQLRQETQTREFLSVEFYKADGTLWILHASNSAWPMVVLSRLAQ